MDDDGLNLHNWGYFEPACNKEHLSLQLMPNVAERGTPSFLPGRDPAVIMNENGAYHHHHHHHHAQAVVSEAFMHPHFGYGRESWLNHKDTRFPTMLPTNLYYNNHLTPDPSRSHSHTLHMVQPPDSLKDEEPAFQNEEGLSIEQDDHQSNKRKLISTPKVPKSRKPRKNPVIKDHDSTSLQRGRVTTKKNMDIVIDGIDMDISSIPIPVCSCTASPQQCYRWGCGGWQSACCTTNISLYPLPMSTKRRGARISGRKMSQGAFKKVLEKLASEGYDFADPIDLKTHWAKHGTNKFVTIK